MDYEYCMKVVSANKENLRKAEAMGNEAAMRSYAESISRNLRKAAGLAPALAGELLAEAEKYDGYVERYLASPPARRSPVRPNSFEDAPKRAPVSSSAPKREEEHEEEQGDGSEYDFGAAQLISSATKVTFDDIVGMEEVKEEIRKTLINPLNHPEAYAKHNLSAGGYTLLWGPPGTGKTTFARAVASQIGVPFFKVDSSELVNKYLGETAKEIKKVFSSVRQYAADNNTPVVLFIDEIDAFARKRESGETAAGAAVPTLLQELQGFDTNSKNIIVIAATNVKDTLDGGVISRFKCIEVPLPDFAARRALIELKLRNAYRVEEVDIAQIDMDEAARRTEGLSGRDITKAVESLVHDIIMRDEKEATIDEPLNDRFLRYLAR